MVRRSYREVDENEDDDEDEPTIPCPHCQEEIHEDSQQCPHCGQYMTDEDTQVSAKPWWAVAGAVLCLYAVYRWVAG